MQKKKSSKSNLENRRPTFFFIGLSAALAISLAAFEYATFYELSVLPPSSTNNLDEEELVPVTMRKQTKTTLAVETKIIDLIEPLPEPFPEPNPDPEPGPEPFPIDPNLGSSLFGDEHYEPEPEIIVNQYQLTKQVSHCNGDNGHFEALQESIEYPKFCLENGIKGTVIVSFVVEKDGSASEFEVIRPVHPLLDDEAIRAAKQLQCWHPGEQLGRKARSRLTLPIRFN